MMVYVLFILGFVLLILGANWLVNGASSIGTKLKIPQIVIGLTIVALGTSLPEMVINIFACYRGDTDLAISNVLGSNIMNILFIVGISAVIYPIRILPGTTWREIPFSMFAALLLGFLAKDIFLWNADANELSRYDGLILLVFFIGFLIYSFKFVHEETVVVEAPSKHTPALKSVILILTGLVLLFLGGKWIVDGALAVSDLLGIAQSETGLVIVASATSLPELVTSIVASLRKKADIAIGNAIGSCIFNIMLVLGISSVITPLPFYPAANLDLFMVILSSLLLFIFVFTLKGRKINRAEGVFMVVLYVAFLVYRMMG